MKNRRKRVLFIYYLTFILLFNFSHKLYGVFFIFFLFLDTNSQVCDELLLYKMQRKEKMKAYRFASAFHGQARCLLA